MTGQETVELIVLIPGEREEPRATASPEALARWDEVTAEIADPGTIKAQTTNIAAFTLAGASEAVNSGLAVYFGIRVWAAPFTLANYVVLGSVGLSALASHVFHASDATHGSNLTPISKSPAWSKPA